MKRNEAEFTARILEAAREEVLFEGWSDAVLTHAANATGEDIARVRAAFPRGAIDLAVAFHMQGDALLAEQLAGEDLSAMRYSERVGHAVFRRLMLVEADRDIVRRSASFMALPIHAGSAARCVWHTADTIWTALGDTSRDYNWYSKRAILSGVYSSAALYWLGDQSEGFADTRAFIDRRIADVMSFEKFKGRVEKSPAFALFRKGPGRLLDLVKAPGQGHREDLPGYWPGR